MSKILSLESLIQERERLRKSGSKVVFTNGCFDLIHHGHVRYLQQARGMGDALIVALNSDRSVHALKGPSRPILNEHERAEIMAALACVDYVLIFDEPSPREILVALQPEILVKGGDYSIDEIVGRAEVEAAGGRVVSLQFVDGISTSEIIDRILKSRA